jgi:hypothetical protein
LAGLGFSTAIAPWATSASWSCLAVAPHYALAAVTVTAMGKVSAGRRCAISLDFGWSGTPRGRFGDRVAEFLRNNPPPDDPHMKFVPKNTP